MKRAGIGLLVAVVAAISIVGCSQLPPTHYYVLELDPLPSAEAGGAGGASGGDAAESGAADAHAGAGAAADASTWIVGVRPFAVDAPYDQDRIVYRVGEGSAEVGFYAYHLWAAPLSTMLAAAVATGLDGAQGVAAVEPVVSGRTYRAFVDGRVLAVEEIDLADRQLVRASIELRLVDREGAELWTDVVTARGETRTEQVGEVVEALSLALAEALGRTRESFGRAVSSHGR
jgi:uncharacterized lipoprotein YmbA